MASVKEPSASVVRAPVWVLGVSALAVMVLVGLLGGAFVEQAVGIDDGGALARIGLPVARVIHDCFAAVTIGLLLLAGTIIPETTLTHRRQAATRLASRTGAVWVVAGVATLLFQVANVSGIAIGDPRFPGQLTAFVWPIDLFRVTFLSVLVALVATIGATVARTTVSITWMAGLSIVALLPLALAGHAGGSADHDTAVNSLAVHLVAAAVWAGGLAALIILRPLLGPAMQVSVARYSLLAVWCYAAIAASGVLNSALRLGGPDGLTSSYGLVVVGKVLLLAAVGLLAWRMRRAVIARLSESEAAGKAFVTMALTEIAAMGFGIGAGVGLSRSAPPVPQVPSADVVTSLTGYPAPEGPLEGWGWFTVVRIDWLWLAVGLTAIALYTAGVIRLHRRGDRWPINRTICWYLGWLFFIWATSGAPGVYGRIQFSVHMLMHMSLSMLIPFFLVLGAPLTLASRTLKARHDKTLGPRELLLKTAHSRYLGFWANPIIASINFFGSLIVFYFTGLFELALRTHTGHVIMIIHFLLAGYMFCWILIGIDPGPKRWAPSLRLVLLFATMSFHAFFGIALISGTALLAGDFFTALNLPWVPNPLADQVDGGAITWGIGEAPMLLLALMVGVVWMRADEHDAKRLDRQAARDHDAALEAYNAELARRAEAYRHADELEAERYAARHPDHLR